MKLVSRVALCLWMVMLSALASPEALAHMMVAQKGTLNFEGRSAYLLVSLPISAFTDFDDDGDRRMSQREFQLHAQQLQQQLQRGLTMMWEGSKLPLELILLNTASPDATLGAPATQMIVMGRYALPKDVTRDGVTSLSFGVGLFGNGPEEDQLDVTFTRLSSSQTLRFTPQTPDRALFTSGRELLTEQFQSGAMHVLAGADHLLFLLVVLADPLAARRSWRYAIALLTVFTLGHSLTLAATALEGLALPPSWVEPAIAASIVLTALLSLWQQRQGRHLMPALQFSLVFGCALVHGLSLGGALQDQGWQSVDLFWALAGFNLGVDAAQLGVAAAAVTLLALVQRLAGPKALSTMTLASSAAAFAMGVWWWIERTSNLG